MLGLPAADLPQFHRWAVELISITVDIVRGVEASQKLRDYFAGVLAERRARAARRPHQRARPGRARRPAPDRRGDLRLPAPAAAGRRGDDLPLVEQPAVRPADRIPTSSTALRADRSLMKRAIEEGLRWEPPLTGIARLAMRDAEVQGVPHPARRRRQRLHRRRQPRRGALGAAGGVRHLPRRRSRTWRSPTAPTPASACTWRAWKRA